MIKRNRNLFGFSVGVAFLLGACKNEACKPDFFKSYNENKDSLSIALFTVKESRNNELCGYNHQFQFWRGVSRENKYIPLILLKGFIYQDNNTIYLIPVGQKNPIKYFDFGMPMGIEQPISYEYKTIDFQGDSTLAQKNYHLVLENKFYDENKKDTIFKFRFKRFGVEVDDNNDLVYYVGKNYGVAGIYNSINDTPKEEILSYRGDIYKSMIDTSKIYLRN